MSENKPFPHQDVSSLVTDSILQTHRRLSTFLEFGKDNLTNQSSSSALAPTIKIKSNSTTDKQISAHQNVDWSTKFHVDKTRGTSVCDQEPGQNSMEFVIFLFPVISEVVTGPAERRWASCKGKDKHDNMNPALELMFLLSSFHERKLGTCRAPWTFLVLQPMQGGLSHSQTSLTFPTLPN